jgi:putative transcriptional regulator
MKNRLRVLRAEHRWSQAELAERLGVSRQTVNAIETEKYDPSLPLAFKIARIFGMKIEEVFQDEAAAGCAAFRATTRNAPRRFRREAFLQDWSLHLLSFSWGGAECGAGPRRARGGRQAR